MLSKINLWLQQALTLIPEQRAAKNPMKFSRPSKKIHDGSDLPAFHRSIAYQNIQDSIRIILELVKSKAIPKNVLNLSLVIRQSSSTSLPPVAHTNYIPKIHNVKVLLEVLTHLDDLIDECPPIDGPRRFGNFAYKTWYEKMETNGVHRLDSLEIPKEKSGFITELSYYLSHSFGSNIRLDFGTGHELSFVAFIGSLLKFDLLSGVDGTDLLVVFAKYYDLVRRLIIVYNLEPAGSHGVWGLDDHFHFIYILGAAQFNDPVAKVVPPVGKCLSEAVIAEYLETNFYINAIAFIKKIKTGPFNEHSPILFDIHNSVSLWKKVLSGLLKMYQVEVLSKFPVVQHFWFGGALYPWKDENLKELPVNSTPSENESTKTTQLPMTAAPWKNHDASSRGVIRPSLR